MLKTVGRIVRYIVISALIIALLLFAAKQIRIVVFDNFCPSDLQEINDTAFTSVQFLGDNCGSVWWHPFRFLERLAFGILAAWMLFYVALRVSIDRLAFVMPLVVSIGAFVPTLLLSHRKQGVLMGVCKVTDDGYDAICPWYAFLVNHNTTFLMTLTIATILITTLRRKNT
jgi:hypothetical protein